MSDWIRLLVKYKGKCAQCGEEIPAGKFALWSRASKAIMHMKCEATVPEKEKIPEVPELDCFVCSRQAGCAECGFEADCDRQVVSQACICSQCMEDKQAFQNYQRAFIEKAHKLAKLKI